MLCGIDEAGRGCAAGPLVVAGVVLKNKIEGLNDSKKLTRQKREKLFENIIQNSFYHICIIDAKTIDHIGLSASIKNALIEITNTLKANRYIFDGNTNFGIKNIKNLIKADSKILEVSAASILAKVTKDKELLKLGKEFPQFSFSSHQGYLTKKHIQEIKQYGLSPIHRKSYKIKALL
jgi:ribonuclease HII